MFWVLHIQASIPISQLKWNILISWTEECQKVELESENFLSDLVI